MFEQLSALRDGLQGDLNSLNLRVVQPLLRPVWKPP